MLVVGKCSLVPVPLLVLVCLLIGQPIAAEPANIIPVGQEIPLQELPDYIRFSRDGKSLLVQTRGICWLCDVANPAIRASGIQGPHRLTGEDRPAAMVPVIGDTSYTAVGNAHFSLDSKSLFVVSIRTIQRWDALRGNSLNRPVRIGGEVAAENAALNPVTGDIFLISASVSYAIPGRPQPMPVTGMSVNPLTGKKVSKPISFDQIPWPGNRDFWQIRQATFSPDGKLLAITHQNAMARLFDVQKGKELVAGGLRPAPPLGDVHSFLVWSPDSKRLLLHTEKGVQLWDSVALAPVGEFIKTAGCSDDYSEILQTRASFSPDSTTLAVPVFGNGRDQDVQLVDATTGQLGRRFYPARMSGRSEIVHLEYLGDSLVVIRKNDLTPTAWLWDPATGEPIAQPTQKIFVRGTAISSDGKHLATFHNVESTKVLQVWRLP
jgi:WD40 repeat protein